MSSLNHTFCLRATGFGKLTRLLLVDKNGLSVGGLWAIKRGDTASAGQLAREGKGSYVRDSQLPYEIPLLRIWYPDLTLLILYM